MAINIPEQEIRQDLEKLKSVPSLKEKRELGAKYGCDPKESGQAQKVIEKIYDLLREYRKRKSVFSEQDVYDFYAISKSYSRYEEMDTYLMLESGAFIKFLLGYLYNDLTNKRGIKKDIVNNIDNIKIFGPDLRYLSSMDRFYLDRYKSIKKYYDDHFGYNTSNAHEVFKKQNNFESMIIEDTYESRLQLEYYLEEFIEECYKKYKYYSKEFTEIYQYTNKIDDENRRTHYTQRDIQQYSLELHRLLGTYRFFDEDDDIKHVTKDQIIEYSIEFFNEEFNKFCYKDLVNRLIKRNLTVDDIKISELKSAPFGFYITINYNNKALYLNFILQHENMNYTDMNEYMLNIQHVNKIYKRHRCIAYKMNISTKLLNIKTDLNESFDFNTVNLALDNFDDEVPISQTISKVKSKDLTSEWLDLMKDFVDLGLPSGTLWAKYNLGADCGDFPEDWNGSYYAWGDPICDRKSWGEADYKFTGKMIKYNNYDKLIDLLPEDDQATQVNKNFKTPTADQIQELVECTKMRWVDNYNNISGLSGCLCINKKEPNSYIFIPASGYISWNGKEQNDIKVALSTATRYERDPYRCYVLIVQPDDDDDVYPYLTNSMYRTIGVPIRPVYNG